MNASLSHFFHASVVVVSLAFGPVACVAAAEEPQPEPAPSEPADIKKPTEAERSVCVPADCRQMCNDCNRSTGYCYLGQCKCQSTQQCF